MTMPSSRRFAALALIGFALLLAVPAGAQNITCTASMSALAFGTVNPQSSLTTANATLSYACTNSANSTRSATVCFSIGEPGGGQTNPRLMHDAAGDALQFQLYQNASYSLVWGSTFFGSFLTPLQVPVTLTARGTTGPRTATMYGQVLNNRPRRCRAATRMCTPTVIRRSLSTRSPAARRPDRAARRRRGSTFRSRSARPWPGSDR